MKLRFVRWGKKFLMKCITILKIEMNGKRKIFKTFKSVKLAKFSEWTCNANPIIRFSIFFLIFFFSFNFCFLRFHSFACLARTSILPFMCNDERRKKPDLCFTVSPRFRSIENMFPDSKLMICSSIVQFDSKMFCHYWDFFFSSFILHVRLLALILSFSFFFFHCHE